MDDVVGLVHRLSVPGRSLDHKEVRTVHRLAGLFVQFLQHLVQDFVTQRAGAPVAAVFSCDITPLSTVQTYTAVSNGVRVVRRGRTGSDFCINRGFWFDDQGHRLAVFASPAKLFDKSAWSQYSSLRTVMSYPAELEHVGLSVCHHVFDRAICSAMTRK